MAFTFTSGSCCQLTLAALPEAENCHDHDYNHNGYFNPIGDYHSMLHGTSAFWQGTASVSSAGGNGEMDYGVPVLCLVGIIGLTLMIAQAANVFTHRHK